MLIGTHILAWRRYKGFKQAELAVKAGMSRPYLSRLEKGEVDPTLSSLQRLAIALDITVGDLVDATPPQRTLTRQELDELARAAIRPGTKAAQRLPPARILARLIKAKRRALGLYTPRNKKASMNFREARHAGRWLRASVGEKQWKALLNRIDKVASQHAGQP